MKKKPIRKMIERLARGEITRQEFTFLTGKKPPKRRKPILMFGYNTVSR